ncbi:GNAT family N-acetyltransferase [Aureimonas fodinaquatilis]|uniref:GNAT family N-acetyltransferase n=1 Tax=Aureimonas fodinaquatilis TaxID=2565783 RepID=A0A5B0E1W5_9HYPH|nr:GNAT family protein [Aureimonas fodinaquatilis]KAA0972115.1 GNAT family N-acetyltransferase [Aureimonas fodinaquatilis]
MSADLADYSPRAAPGQEVLRGRHVDLEPVSREHLSGLYAAFSAIGGRENWQYMHYGPFEDLESFKRFAEATYFGEDPFFYTVMSKASGKPLGVLALMRIDRANGVIEIGNIFFSPALQRSREASEALYLAMERVFGQLGYRRYEWKCDNANAPSRKAAARLGFTFEGVFRQHMIRKGVNRDTAWFSIIDQEWPELQAAFQAYLADDNYDSEGRQLQPLSAFQARRHGHS